MDKVMFLIFGNHPKANNIKERAIKVARLLKSRDDWVDLTSIEAELQIDRNESPSLFYKPLSAMKKWRLLDSKRQVTGQRGKSVVYTTYYKYTPERFLSFLKDGLFSICETEIKMFK
jgi:hypothetical protein